MRSNKAGLTPIDTHVSTAVRTMTSTGSPLAPESFDFVYDHIKHDIHLASISGGTDIVSCFVGGNPDRAGLARRDSGARARHEASRCSTNRGEPVPPGEKGELVCTMPFPSMPVGFWNDPDGQQVSGRVLRTISRACGTTATTSSMTEHDGVIIYGRSDAVLNPGGVRIGTAEIYRQVEQLDEIVESLVIGQQWGHDERIVLFVRLRDGV